MPTVLLPVPHFEQSQDGLCLPASARMILAFLGDHRSEATIAKQLGSRSFGTPITNLGRLQQWGYQVDLNSLTQTQLQENLRQQKPTIARVWTVMLDYWQVDVSHVLVVVGFDDQGVYVNDPAFGQSAQFVSWNGFLAAWAEYDETSAVIDR